MAVAVSERLFSLAPLDDASTPATLHCRPLKSGDINEASGPLWLSTCMQYHHGHVWARTRSKCGTRLAPWLHVRTNQCQCSTGDESISAPWRMRRQKYFSDPIFAEGRSTARLYHNHLLVRQCGAAPLHQHRHSITDQAMALLQLSTMNECTSPKRKRTSTAPSTGRVDDCTCVLAKWEKPRLSV